jgi:hypothetical protein
VVILENWGVVCARENVVGFDLVKGLGFRVKGSGFRV